LEELGFDFESFNKDENVSGETSFTNYFSWKGLSNLLLIGFDSKNNREFAVKHIQFAWIAGLVYFLIGFPDSGMDYARYVKNFDPDLYPIYTIVKIISFLSMVIMQRGFIVLGDFFDNYLLKITSYLIIIHDLFNTIYSISSLYIPSIQSEHADQGIALTIGAILILFGISLHKMSRQTGNVAKITGIFTIISGAFFLTLILWFMGLIMLIPIELLEIIFLFKGYELLSKEVK
jgi:multisubunit Na+/H+ antiporter MnhG subunit